MIESEAEYRKQLIEYMIPIVESGYNIMEQKIQELSAHDDEKNSYLQALAIVKEIINLAHINQRKRIGTSSLFSQDTP